jgi:hypothetical protein
VLVAKSLDDPQRLAIDAAGAIYVSDRGQSHNVKVFTASGRLLRTIGKPGVPSVGPYDQERMNNPAGLTVTDDGHLWVAEADEAPRRVSVWKTDGTFVRALYGGVRYGGGGMLDPHDATRFYYGPDDYGMEFKVDWQRGTSQLVHVYHRPACEPRARVGSPETPIDAFGRRYFTNQNNCWLHGTNLIRIWLLCDGRASSETSSARFSRTPTQKRRSTVSSYATGCSPGPTAMATATCSRPRSRSGQSRGPGSCRSAPRPASN